MLISEVWDEFVQYKILEEDRSEGTIEKYDDCIRRFIGLEGDLEIESISKQHINDVRLQLRNLSKARLSSILNCVRTFLRYCQEEKGLKVLDPSLIKIPSIDDQEIVYLTNEEVKAFLENIDMSTLQGLRTRALCEFLLDTGARISEATQLDRTSIVKEDGVTIARVIGKGKKQRKLFLSGRGVFWIEKYLEAREDNHPALFVSHKDGTIPQRLRNNGGTKNFKIIALKAGIRKRISPHIFRHTFLTNLLKNGCSLAVLQRLAGHSSIQITLKFYARLDDRDLIMGKDKLNYETVDNYKKEEIKKVTKINYTINVKKPMLQLAKVGY